MALLTFPRAWAASTLSLVSTRTLSVTYPLLAIGLSGSPAWAGWVVCAATLPGLVCYVPAGALCDRLGAHRVMIGSEVVRAALIILLCAGMLAQEVRVEHLLVVAVVEGALSAVSSVAELAVITMAARAAGQPPSALALHEVTVHAVGLTSRPLGGALYGLDPMAAFLPNAVCGLAAAGVLLRASSVPHEAAPRRRLREELVAGFTEGWRHGFLRSATILTALVNAGVQAASVVCAAHLTLIGENPAAIGAALAGTSAGGIAGGLISAQSRAKTFSHAESTERVRATAGRPVADVLRSGTMLVAHMGVCSLALALICLSRGDLVVFAAALVMIGLTGGLSNVVFKIGFGAVPAAMLVRVVGASRMVTFGASALGPPLAIALY
ncbi:MFS transporter [Nonomuraea sp. KM90]|uniref:MFS transporter n=1 Tax=Nonomuraea sp. KM90 TaxID=3457428 RepID=UPI003FCD9018